MRAGGTGEGEEEDEAGEDEEAGDARIEVAEDEMQRSPDEVGVVAREQVAQVGVIEDDHQRRDAAVAVELREALGRDAPGAGRGGRRGELRRVWRARLRVHRSQSWPLNARKNERAAKTLAYVAAPPLPRRDGV